MEGLSRQPQRRLIERIERHLRRTTERRLDRQPDEQQLDPQTTTSLKE